MVCFQQGKALWEGCPDICPQGYLTQTEAELWGMYQEWISDAIERGRNK